MKALLSRAPSVWGPRRMCTFVYVLGWRTVRAKGEHVWKGRERVEILNEVRFSEGTVKH